MTYCICNVAISPSSRMASSAVNELKLMVALKETKANGRLLLQAFVAWAPSDVQPTCILDGLWHPSRPLWRIFYQKVHTCTDY